LSSHRPTYQMETTMKDIRLLTDLEEEQSKALDALEKLAKNIGVRFDTKKELQYLLNETKRKYRIFVNKELRPFIRYYEGNKFNKRVRRTAAQARAKTLADIKYEQLKSKLNSFRTDIRRLEAEIKSL